MPTRNAAKVVIGIHSIMFLQNYLSVLLVALRTILPKVMKNATITPAMIHSIHYKSSNSFIFKFKQ